jgi:glycosyltransferase involved in cell wall biosynthesis
MEARMGTETTPKSVESARVAFIVPRYSCDHVRVGHKEAMTFQTLGCDVTILCRNPPGDQYLGMRTMAARGTSSRLALLFCTPLHALQALRLRADLYVVVNPFSIMVGLLLAFAGRRVVYSTHEDFGQKALIRTHVPKALRSFVGHAIVLLERLLARMSQATIVTQSDIRHRYARSLLIGNAPLTSGPIVEEASAIHASLESNAVPTLIYAGAINRDRGLFRMLDIAVLLNETHPWRLVLAGPMSAADHSAARTHAGWKYVDYVGFVSHARSLALIRRATFGLGLLSDVGGYSRTSMTKLYEYMLMETPFVVSDFPCWRESVRGLAAGLFVDPTETDLTARQIDAIYRDPARYRSMQRAGRLFIEQEFNWSLESRPLHKLLVNGARIGQEQPSEA